jgi:hypothetical protein
MGQRIQGSQDSQRSNVPKRLIGRLPLVFLVSCMLLSCERNPAPNIPPDNPPKPHAGEVPTHAGIRSAVYSYVGHPAPLYRPETPIPVHHAEVRT